MCVLDFKTKRNDHPAVASQDDERKRGFALPAHSNQGEHEEDCAKGHGGGNREKLQIRLQVCACVACFSILRSGALGAVRSNHWPGAPRGQHSDVCAVPEHLREHAAVPGPVLGVGAVGQVACPPGGTGKVVVPVPVHEAGVGGDVGPLQWECRARPQSWIEMDGHGCRGRGRGGEEGVSDVPFGRQRMAGDLPIHVLTCRAQCSHAPTLAGILNFMRNSMPELNWSGLVGTSMSI